RYRPKYSNPKPLERTQNWIKLGGKVRRREHFVFGKLVRSRRKQPYFLNHTKLTPRAISCATRLEQIGRVDKNYNIFNYIDHNPNP
ncbi:hypothetical protein FG152_26485, partial [Ochrobactrum sp. XJ1]|nr:hypothetical protein [Ochrobactrum sp. XJ1]